MYDDLIIVTYPQQAEAVMAWVRLHLLHNSLSLGINNALLLIISETGKAHAMQVSELARFPNCREMRFLGSLTRQIINCDHEQVKHLLVDAGIEETFVNGLTQALIPGSSAMIFYAPADCFIDVSQLLTVLSQEMGMVHQTTLTPDTAERIRGQV